MVRFCLAYILVCSSPAYGGLILFDFTDTTGNPTANTVTGVTFGPMAFVGAGAVINNTSASSTTDYALASGGGNIGGRVENASINLSSSYFGVSISNTTGEQLILNDFDFGARSTGTGATNFQLRSSFDLFGSVIASTTNLQDSDWTFKNLSFAPISLGNSASLEFRIYAFGGANSSQANTRLDDIRFDVITAVPEPSSMALVGFMGGVATVWGWRKRRREVKVTEH